METSFIFLTAFSALFTIISTIGAYMLYNKTKTLSTLSIFIGFLMGLVLSTVFVVFPVLGLTYAKFVTMGSFIAGSLTSIGFFVYALSLKIEKRIQK